MTPYKPDSAKDAIETMSAERRILHVVTKSEWGGAQQVVQLLATGTEGEVTVACGPGGKLVDELRSAGIRVFEQSSLKSTPDPAADVRALFDLWRLLQSESFDLVHCHSTKAGFLGRLAATLTSTPSIFTVHGWGFYNPDSAYQSKVLTYGERIMARFTDFIVCVSNNDLAQGRKRDILTKTETQVIHNGIPPISLPTNRESLYEDLEIDSETPTIGSIARLAPQKDPLAILATGNRLEERGHDVTTVLIGDGPLAEECQTYAKTHTQDIHVLGFRQQARELLADFDVFLLPSRFEGFPITVLECLHLGVPVVAYDVGGVSEAITDGQTGFVVKAGDHEAFVDRTEQLVFDASLRNRMSRRAKKMATEKYTADRMTRDYDRIYSSVLAGR